MAIVALNVVMAVRTNGKLTPITEPRAADAVADKLLDQPAPEVPTTTPSGSPDPP